MDHIDVPDLISVLCGFRKEASHEPLVALLSFSAWLHWPNGTIVDDARVAAGALVIRNLLSGKLTPVQTVEKDIREAQLVYMQPETICAALLDREHMPAPFYVEYDVLDHELDLARSIAEYMLRSPKLPKASLNRARFFIASGGFAVPQVASQTCQPSSLSTSKNAWVNFARVSPFLLAAKHCKLKIVELAPDDPSTFAKASRLLDRDLLIHYFSIVKSMQQKLIDALPSDAAPVINFVRLPDRLPLIGIELPEFNEAQRKILKSYSVEKATKIRLR